MRNSTVSKRRDIMRPRDRGLYHEFRAKLLDESQHLLGERRGVMRVFAGVGQRLLLSFGPCSVSVFPSTSALSLWAFQTARHHETAGPWLVSAAGLAPPT